MNWLAIAPWILSAVFALGGFTAYEIERGNYQSEKAGRIADAAAARDAADKKLADAKAESDAALAEREQKIASLSTTTTVFVDRIKNAPPSACPPSAAARDASRGAGLLLRPANPTGGPATQ